MAGSGYKWLTFPAIFFMGVFINFHPLHVSVVEANHNTADHTLEVSCKIFTDDFEKVLIKNYKTKVDLGNPTDKAPMDSLVKRYVISRLAMKVNGSPVSFSYVGFEQEGEAVYCYLEVLNVNSLKRLDITTSLMYDLFDDQMNIVHVRSGSDRKSTKIDYPATNAVVTF